MACKVLAKAKAKKQIQSWSSFSMLSNELSFYLDQNQVMRDLTVDIWKRNLIQTWLWNPWYLWCFGFLAVFQGGCVWSYAGKCGDMHTHVMTVQWPSQRKLWPSCKAWFGVEMFCMFINRHQSGLQPRAATDTRSAPNPPTAPLSGGVKKEVRTDWHSGRDSKAPAVLKIHLKASTDSRSNFCFCLWQRNYLWENDHVGIFSGH